MDKAEAIRLLGGTTTSAAKAIGIKPQAVSAWPNQLTPAIRDRVQAALWRKRAAKRPTKKLATHPHEAAQA